MLHHLTRVSSTTPRASCRGAQDLAGWGVGAGTVARDPAAELRGKKKGGRDPRITTAALAAHPGRAGDSTDSAPAPTRGEPAEAQHAEGARRGDRLELDLERVG